MVPTNLLKEMAAGVLRAETEEEKRIKWHQVIKMKIILTEEEFRSCR